MAASVSRPKAGGSRVYLRLRRYGARGEGGPARYHAPKHGGLYRRDGIYPVDDQDRARYLLATGAFEQIPESQLELAKRVAKTPRGQSLDERSRRARAARAGRRPVTLVEEAAAVDGTAPADNEAEGLELA